MKYTLLLFLLCSLFAQAQTITKDYTLGSDGTTYFEVTTVTQDDGSYVVTANPVGPAAELAKDQADKIEARMEPLRYSGFVVSFARKRLLEEIKNDSTILALTGTSPLQIIQNRYAPELLTPGWTIDQGAGFIPLVFTVNAQGMLRYSVNGAATRQAQMYGPILRLINYPSNGNNMELFLSENGSRYFSLPNRVVVVKKP
jgi:hypothetical protein